MGRFKKATIAVLLVAVILVGSLAGLALAQTGTSDTAQPKTLLERVAGILGIDQQTLSNAVGQAQREMRNEAVDSYLKNLVEKGVLTKAQADAYATWYKARPDTPLGALDSGLGSRGLRCGMRGGRGFCWGGPTAPVAPTPQASSTSL